MSSNGRSSRTSALYQLLSPDGYYTYLGLDKPIVNRSTRFQPSEEIQEDPVLNEQINKNYRKLSLKHHPDRKGGDAETFRVLARARKVLTTPKLRREYDLLGLDLDDDEVGEDHQQHTTDPPEGSTSRQEQDQNDNNQSSSNPTNDTVLSAFASATLTSLLQMMVRTAMMAAVSTFISRYKVMLIIAAVLLILITIRVRQNGGGKREFAVLSATFAAICLMHSGRNRESYLIFWFGEAITMTIFVINSFALKSLVLIGGSSIFSAIACSLLQGRLWRYSIVIISFGVLTILTAVVFPILDMILEEIIRDKMTRVGERIRAHSHRIDEEMKRLGVLSAGETASKNIDKNEKK